MVSADKLHNTSIFMLKDTLFSHEESETTNWAQVKGFSSNKVQDFFFLELFQWIFESETHLFKHAISYQNTSSAIN